MKIEIKNRFNGSVIFECEALNIKAALEIAVSKKSNLRGANLRDANLGGANLRDANLGGANLGDANLRGANLRDANLRGANLRGAYLGDANLGDANLRGANLGDANLRGANLRGANLRDARYGDDVPLTKNPLYLTGLYYDVLIVDKHIKIGCELHSTDEWINFDDEQIEAMDYDAAIDFWSEHKDTIINLAEKHQAGIES